MKLTLQQLEAHLRVAANLRRPPAEAAPRTRPFEAWQAWRPPTEKRSGTGTVRAPLSITGGRPREPGYNRLLSAGSRDKRR